MMTEQLQVSILAAPLAAIDRRALSQAWYAALQRAPRQPTTAAATQRASMPARAFDRVRPSVVPARRGKRLRCAVPNAQGKPARRALADVAAGAQRRCRFRSELAGRIERAFFDARGALRRATFSLGRGNVRVHVILQTKGGKAVLLALCPPEIRDVVARALTEARLALAARGIGLEVHAREIRRCS
jgi:hypothetical protein